MTLSSSIFAFLRLHRREHFASDFPSFLSENQRKFLLSSSLSNDKLFDNDLILKFAEELTSKASVSANIEMSRTLPKLTSALVSSSSASKRQTQRAPSRQSSYKRGRTTVRDSRENRSSSSRFYRRRSPPRPQRRYRGSASRGRSSSRGYRGSSRGGNQRQRQSTDRHPFQK